MNKEVVKAALTSLKQLTLGNSSKLYCARLTVALVFMLVGLVLGGIIGYGVFGRCGTATYKTVRDTTTYVDTIPYYMPAPKDSAVVRYITRYLPVAKPQGMGSRQPADTILTEFYAQNNGENIPPQEMSDERDSIAVAIPITQKRYENDDYRAYVSGYEPNLDSIYVFPKTTVIHERSYKPPNKWHIGITGGYGYGFKSKQAEPYIGIGITYSIISF